MTCREGNGRRGRVGCSSIPIFVNNTNTTTSGNYLESFTEAILLINQGIDKPAKTFARKVNHNLISNSYQ